LLAHHYLEAIAYARAAGGAVAELAGPARVALREAGDRAFGLASYRQAARFFETALELADHDEAARAEILARLGASQFWWDARGEVALADAEGRLRDLGRPEAAAGAALLLARAAWVRGDGSAAESWIAEVDRLLGDLPGSPVELEALVIRSGFSLVGGEYERAIASATEALSRLEQLDRPDLRARALDIIGSSRCGLGQLDGLEDQRRAIEVARDGRAVWELHHAINNSCVSCIQFGRLAAATELQSEWESVFDSIGATRYNRDWFEAARATGDYWSGRWDDALERISRLLAGLPAGRTHYLETDALHTRARMLAARGGWAEARADVERGVTVAEGVGDPQTVAPIMCLRARLRLTEGRTAEAVSDFERVLAIPEGLLGALNGSTALPELAWLGLDLGRQADVEALLEDAMFPRWTAVAKAILADEHIAAADLLGEIGERPTEAHARLRAGGRHVQHALAFYESVGAVHAVGEGRRLLAASA
jgi:tetratricopeptide (TPR) repeat protein